MEWGDRVARGVIRSWVYVVIVFLQWPNFMLRCTLLLYFSEHTSCYVAHFCCTSLTKFHVMLRTSVAFRWPNIMLRCTLLFYYGAQAHIDVIDNGWKACKDMLPSSFPSHTPMIMTHDICQSLAYIDMLMPRLGIHRNADVCDNTARRSASWTDGMESLAMSRNASTCKKRNVFWRCSTCIFEFPLR